MPLGLVTPLILLLTLSTFWLASGQTPQVAKTPFHYESSHTLSVVDSIIEQQNGLTVHQITFPSPKGGKVTGILVVPQGKGPFAGVLLAHGMPSSARAYIPRAKYVARHRAIVLALDAPFARRSGEALSFTPQDSSEQVQMIVDLRRSLDWLVSRPDIDPTRVAFVGRSYGGTIGVLLAGVEPRLKSYILSVADGGLVTHFTDPGYMGETFRSLPKAQQARWVAAMLPLEPIRYIQQRKRVPILFQNGLSDPAIPLAKARQLHQLTPGPKTIKWYKAGHDLTVGAYLDQLRFLHETIGTTPPTASDTKAPVVTPHVGTH